MSNSPPFALAPRVPVASSPTPSSAHRQPPRSGLGPLASGLSRSVSPAMPRFFANEHILQIIPAPRSLRAQYADGCPDEPVLCLALLSVPGDGEHPKTPYQTVMPMVAYHGSVEFACDIDRPYLRLSTESS